MTHIKSQQPVLGRNGNFLLFFLIPEQTLSVRSRWNESFIDGAGVDCRRVTEWKMRASSAVKYPASNLLRYCSEKGERERI